MAVFASRAMHAGLACVLLLGPVVSFGQEQADKETVSSAQNAGMADNLQDVVPDSDLQDKVGLENARIVVQENLKELGEVRVVGSFHEMGAELKEMVGENRERLEDDPTFSQRMEVVGDQVMDVTRFPLTYVQEHVPFFTKRNIIFFGRLEPELAWYSSGALEDESGFHFRRFRVGLAGHVKWWDGWNYKLELDLTDGENTLSDAYLSWRWQNWGTIRIGNQKIPQTLSGATSSLSIPFMERPLPVLAFTLNHRLGVGYHLHRGRQGLDVTLFGQDPNKGNGSSGYSARYYFNPSRSDIHVLHIGASVMGLSSDDDARLRARPESNLTNIRLVDTGTWPEVQDSNAVGLEVAGSRGPVSLRSEFYRAQWQRDNDTDPTFKGWYLEASWFPTGEMANYREGKFIRLTISNDRGAWEIAVRFSTLDLNDEDVEGGEEQNLSVALNWYSTTHWRLMLNVIKVNSDGPEGNENPWIVQTRAQYYF